MFSNKHATENKQPTKQPINAKLPDGSYMQSTHEDNIHIPQLPAAATRTSIFPVLNTSLISIGQFCDAGCSVLFDAFQAKIFHNNQLILTGTRTPPGLWYTDIPAATQNVSQSDSQQEQQVAQPTTQATKPYHQTQAHASNATTSTTAEHIQFLHAAAFSPVTSTWIDAIRNGHFLGWPGLTAEAVTKHLPKSFATAQGHLDQS